MSLFFSKTLESKYEEIPMSEFTNLKPDKKYILEFLPTSNTGEKYVEMVVIKYNDEEYPATTLVAKIKPKCVAIINKHGCAKVSKSIYLGISRFKFDFNIFEKIEENK